MRLIWPVDRVEGFALDFLRRATIGAVCNKGRGLGERWISNWNGSLTSEMCRQFEESSEWLLSQDILLRVAEAQEAGAVNADAEVLTRLTRRRGYRAEVRRWMARKDLKTVAEAAKWLGVSGSTLKSIMTDRGETRYSQETLDRVLGIVVIAQS
jgi:hypothetical protein